jgi:hypothetical protein
MVKAIVFRNNQNVKEKKRIRSESILITMVGKFDARHGLGGFSLDESFTKSKGFDAILVLVVVNRFGKYGNFILILPLYSARSIVEMFAKKAVKLHTSVVSDREPTYFSHFWKELFRTEGTGLMMSTPYHPESDGKTEVLNRTLETYLRCFSSEQQNTWTILCHWDE